MALDITTRFGWGARTNRIGYPMGRVAELVVHHFYSPDVPASASRETERRVMRGVEAYHASTSVAGGPWSAAPGYTWVIFDSGRVYQSTGWGRTGVHTQSRNSSAVAFCFAINGDPEQPTPQAWQAAHLLARQGVARGYLTSGYDLSTHNKYAPWKSCPGDATRPHIGKIRTGVTAPEPEPAATGDDMRLGDEGPEILILRHWVGVLLGQDLGDNQRYTKQLAVKVGDAHEKLGFRRITDVASGFFQTRLYLRAGGHWARWDQAHERTGRLNQRVLPLERQHRDETQEFPHVPHIHPMQPEPEPTPEPM